MPAYTKPERLYLKRNADYDERWVQEQVAEDPSILELGEMILRDKERIQPRAGRLDLLLQEAETKPARKAATPPTPSPSGFAHPTGFSANSV